MSNLKLEHLRTFLAVARFKSVSRAAEALHLTQPAVTTRIKALEDSLGTALFDRSAARLTLLNRATAKNVRRCSSLRLDKTTPSSIPDPGP
ncbi:MAG: LysR family transcriptional regulator [Pseudomonadota bacterium]